MSWPGCPSCSRPSTIFFSPCLLGEAEGRQVFETKTSEECVQFTWQRCNCLVPAAYVCRRDDLAGLFPPEIPGALHIILAARCINLAVPCSYLFCTCLYLPLVWVQSSWLGDQGRQLPAAAARLLCHHVQKAGGLGVGYLGKYSVDKYSRAIN